jgi:ketosteroid isomerase-like protein
MPTTPAKGIADAAKQDKEILFSIVREMSKSMTGAQSTRHWAEDALWFDIPAFASKGVQPALKFFDKVFSNFRSCQVDILEVETVVNGDMGIVCTVQRVSVVLKNGDTKLLLARETDCFEKRGNEWKLIHQHASVPSGGEWDGKILTAY